jgi:hypothetical protein
VTAMAVAFFSLLFALSWGDVSSRRARCRIAHIHWQRLRRANFPPRTSRPSIAGLPPRWLPAERRCWRVALASGGPVGDPMTALRYE